MEKLNNFFSKLLARFIAWLSSPFFKKLLVDTLEKQAIKFVLKKLVISGGLKGWLISFVIGEIIEKDDKKAVEPLFRKFNLFADTIDGKTVYREIDNAESRDDWRDNISRS